MVMIRRQIRWTFTEPLTQLEHGRPPVNRVGWIRRSGLVFNGYIPQFVALKQRDDRA